MWLPLLAFSLFLSLQFPCTIHIANDFTLSQSRSFSKKTDDVMPFTFDSDGWYVDEN